MDYLVADIITDSVYNLVFQGSRLPRILPSNITGNAKILRKMVSNVPITNSARADGRRETQVRHGGLLAGAK